MNDVGPFTFNAVRFGLGALALIPVLTWLRSSKANSSSQQNSPGSLPLKGGFLAGLALFLGSSFQQVGMVSTSAGKAGFITGLYVLIVPVLGLLWGQRPHRTIWIGAALAVIGLFLLSETQNPEIVRGDVLVLCSALFWAIHVQLVGWLTVRIEPVALAFWQFTTCSALAGIISLVWERPTQAAIMRAGIPILYAGFISAGVAYTLQVVAQRYVKPTPAAIILSLEAVFAAVGGWLIIDEVLSGRAILGCLLMLTGMVVSQVRRSDRPCPS